MIDGGEACRSPYFNNPFFIINTHTPLETNIKWNAIDL